MSKEIGLKDLIDQVKKELSVQSDHPVLWVEKVELELNVTVKREGNTVIKIGILSIGEASVNGKLSSEDVHKIKVTLNPLLPKEDVLRNLSLAEQEKLNEETKRTGVQGTEGIRS
jgi:hypothetical protein